MQTNLHNKYGFCLIPKGVFLFRGHNSNEIIDAIFFTTKSSFASGWGNGIEVWKTKKRFKLLFLVSQVDNLARAKSSIPEIYYEVFPNEPNRQLDDLDIKQDVKRRDFFSRKLFSYYDVKGWLSSIENHNILEVCLFNKEFIQEHIEFVKTIENGEEFKKDSLRKIKIYPTTLFFEMSRKAISNNYIGYFNSIDKTLYKKHRSRIRSYVNDFIERGGTEEEAKDYYFDLRTKLKI